MNTLENELKEYSNKLDKKLDKIENDLNTKIDKILENWENVEEGEMPKLKTKIYTTADQIDDLYKSIFTATDIIEVYKNEISEEFQKEKINFNTIKKNKTNIDDLKESIKKMEKLIDDLSEKWELEEKQDDYIFKNIDIGYDEYEEYKAWRLEELYNEDGSY